MTILIDVNRYTIKVLEKACDKHNNECERGYSIHDYNSMITWLCEQYLKSKKLSEGKKG